MGKKNYLGQITAQLKKLCMDNKFKLIIDSFGSDRFKIDERLEDYTALNSGGPAKLFFIAFTIAELIKIVKMCRDLKLLFFIFGTGSKIMISEEGFPGLVIKNRTKNIQTISIKGKVTKFGIGVEEALVEVDSGVSINKFIEFLDNQNLSSEQFKAIPGSIGGSLFLSKFLQNATKSIKVLDSDCEIEEITAFELNAKKHIILSAVFKVHSRD